MRRITHAAPLAADDSVCWHRRRHLQPAADSAPTRVGHPTPELPGSLGGKVTVPGGHYPVGSAGLDLELGERSCRRALLGT